MCVQTIFYLTHVHVDRYEFDIYLISCWYPCVIYIYVYVPLYIFLCMYIVIHVVMHICRCTSMLNRIPHTPPTQMD